MDERADKRGASWMFPSRRVPTTAEWSIKTQHCPRHNEGAGRTIEASAEEATSSRPIFTGTCFLA